jgi:DNA-binding LacI/PurR family transcriptional regulator
MRTTIKDIAAKAGVSKTTVSFAFNDPARISRQTYEKIMKIADQIGYVPDPVARTLAKKTIGTMGLLLPQPVAEVFCNPYTGEFLKGIGEICEKENLTISLIPPVRGMISLAVRNAMVDIFVLFGVDLERKVVQLMSHRHLPFITVDGEVCSTVPNVGIDDRKAAFDLMDHILSLGHRRVEIIGLQNPACTLSDDRGSPARVSATLRRRLSGFRQALQRYALEIGGKGVRAHSCACSEKAASLLARRVLSRQPKPTAVVCMSDVAAYGVYQAARSLELRIPEDLSIAGFDDLDLSSLLSPPLTSVHQPGSEKGRQAARMAVDILKGRAVESKVLESRLIVRSSTAFAPR